MLLTTVTKINVVKLKNSTYENPHENHSELIPIASPLRGNFLIFTKIY